MTDTAQPHVPPQQTTVPPPVTDRPTGGMFLGYVPRRPWLVAGVSVLIGFVLTTIWSAEFVDQTIGVNVADGILGEGAAETATTGVLAGIAFAFVSGLAGTFTACNIAVFGALAPMLGKVDSRGARVRAVLTPLLWLSVGVIAVSAIYGAVVGLVGTDMPQFSTAQSTPGSLSPRSIQSMITFGGVGLAMCWLGLASLGLVRDPLARVSRAFPHAPVLVLGALIGAFLIGRPFPMFRMMFRDAAESGNPLYGAAAFVLQGLGNILLVAVVFLLLALVSGRVTGWLAADPRRLAVLAGGALLIAGVFMVLYWDVRLLYRREIIPWYPMAPWA